MSYGAYRHYMTKGYVYLDWPSHPNANTSGRVREHIAVAAQALGRPVPAQAVVHHVNDKTDDNRPSNLVICQDDAYHKRLHYRRRIFRAGGDPFKDAICSTCRAVKNRTEFSPRRNGPISRECKPCMSARMTAYKKAVRASRVLR